MFFLFFRIAAQDSCVGGTGGGLGMKAAQTTCFFFVCSESGMICHLSQMPEMMDYYPRMQNHVLVALLIDKLPTHLTKT